jgi:hypothetical protein
MSILVAIVTVAFPLLAHLQMPTLARMKSVVSLYAVVSIVDSSFLAMGVWRRELPGSQEGECLPPQSWGETNNLCHFQYIALRYQLIPYVKGLFGQLQETGKSIMRPLYYDFSLSDPFVASGTKANDPIIVHQYMFGMLSYT